MKIKNGRRRIGFTLVEIMIVVSILIMIASIAIPSFMRARQRTQASWTLDAARMLDSAIDQWAIENSLDNGVDVNASLTDLANFFRSDSKLQAALIAGTAPTDALGNDFVFGVTGPDQLLINPATKTALGSVVVDWAGY